MTCWELGKQLRGHAGDEDLQLCLVQGRDQIGRETEEQTSGAHGPCNVWLLFLLRSVEMDECFSGMLQSQDLGIYQMQ
jgi:hypothetical protein